jgi:hypothetical protein
MNSSCSMCSSGCMMHENRCRSSTVYRLPRVVCSSHLQAAPYDICCTAALPYLLTQPLSESPFQTLPMPTALTQRGNANPEFVSRSRAHTFCALRCCRLRGWPAAVRRSPGRTHDQVHGLRQGLLLPRPHGQPRGAHQPQPQPPAAWPATALRQAALDCPPACDCPHRQLWTDLWHHHSQDVEAVR